MTSQELLLKAIETNPKVRIQDVRAILRKMDELGFVKVLNPSAVTGRLYVFESDFDPAFDWDLYAWVIRGKARKAILEEIGRIGLHGVEPKSASQIKKYLKETYSISLNSVIDTLRDLKTKKLISCCSNRKYRLSELGVRIIKQIHI